jgi:hypothetical protein
MPEMSITVFAFGVNRRRIAKPLHSKVLSVLSLLRGLTGNTRQAILATTSEVYSELS